MTKKYLKTPEEMIDALQAGKKIEAGDFEYRLVGEVIIAINKTDKSWAVNAGIYSDDIPFIDEPESPKLEVGKFYKTRRGDKVVCLCQKGDFYIHRLNSYIVGYWVDKTGRMLFNGVPERTETDSDVVALWEDNNDK